MQNTASMTQIIPSNWSQYQTCWLVKHSYFQSHASRVNIYDVTIKLVQQLSYSFCNLRFIWVAIIYNGLRDIGMEIICAGYPKTGSKSCSSALRALGYNVADFVETGAYLSYQWIDFVNGKIEIEKVIGKGFWILTKINFHLTRANKNMFALPTSGFLYMWRPY